MNMLEMLEDILSDKHSKAAKLADIAGKQTEELVVNRCNELGISMGSFPSGKKVMFHTIAAFERKGVMYWFKNDGTEDGQRIMALKMPKPDFETMTVTLEEVPFPEDFKPYGEGDESEDD